MNYIALVTLFIQTVKNVEELMPDSPGKEKFDVAVTIVEQVLGSIQDHLPGLQTLATNAVATFRKLGVFKTTT